MREGMGLVGVLRGRDSSSRSLLRMTCGWRGKGEDERGNEFSWCAPGARFFVAEPPQNDMRVRGKGEDRIRPPCRSTRTGFSPE